MKTPGVVNDTGRRAHAEARAYRMGSIELPML